LTSALKATVEQAQLLKCLGRVHRVVERRNTIPILGNVLLDVRQDSIAFRATDLDLMVDDAIPAAVAAKGTTTVPAFMLHDIARKMPIGSQIVIEQEGETLIVKSGRSRFKLHTLPPTDFPDLSAGALTHQFAISGKDLHRLIDKSSFAISTEETRYYLNGIYLHAAGSHNAPTLRAVATDGHRRHWSNSNFRMAPTGCRASSCRGRQSGRYLDCSTRRARSPSNFPKGKFASRAVTSRFCQS
jgi:DNA polymerase-3 subunit beta